MTGSSPRNGIIVTAPVTNLYKGPGAASPGLQPGWSFDRSQAPPPPPLDPLPLIWHAAAQRLALPCTRMLLLHQGRLIALQERGRLLVAVVAAPPQWLPLIEARRALVARALADTLARPVALELQEVAQ